MKRVRFVGKLCLILVLAMVMMAPGAFAKGKGNTDFETGRTAQQVTTGVIAPDQAAAFSIEEGTGSVTFSGTVTIDGPRLYMTIGGNVVTNVYKIADKVWGYSYTLNTSEFLENVYNIEVYAHSYYPNGTPASDIHTLANSVTHVLTVYKPVVQEDVFTYKVLGFTLERQGPQQLKVTEYYEVYKNGNLYSTSEKSHGNISNSIASSSNPATRDFTGTDGKVYTVSYYYDANGNIVVSFVLK